MVTFLLIAAVVSGRPAAASNIFTPNCSEPPSDVTYVASAPLRGTWDILSSSIFTILLCTWTAQHLNIPAARAPAPDTRLRWVREACLRLKPKLAWLGLALVVPEAMVGQAFQDWCLARRSLERLHSQARVEGAEWGLTHTFFANMGGFVLTAHEKLATSEQPPRSKPLASDTPSSKAGKDSTIVTHSAPVEESEDDPKEVVLYLNAVQLGLARYFGVIASLPPITAAQIEDKSKSDFFIKAIALVQILWLIIQVVARSLKSLPISPLEIAVLGYCLCAAMTYLLCWHKPQDVQLPLALTAAKPITATQMAALNRASNRIFLKGRTLRNVKAPISGPVVYPDVALTTFYGRKYYYRDLAMVVAGVMFGLPHVIAWNFAFPTSEEQLLWRISTLVCTAGPPLYFAVFMFRGFLEWQFPGLRDDSTTLHIGAGQVNLRTGKLTSRVMLLFDIVWGNIAWAAYVLARLFLMMELFRTLFRLPPGAFITTF